MRRRFLFEWLLMALLLPLAMLWLGERPGLVEADRAVYDELMRGDRRAAPSPDLVIVGIDERSIAALGPWPWSRTLHAQLLEQLAPHAPRSVLFNVFFDTPGPPEDDARLAAAMAGLPVYLPMDLAPLPATASVPGLAPPRPGFATPVPALARAAHGLGHVNATADSDDRVRTLYRYEGTETRLAPYVGLLIASGAQDAAPAHPDFAPDAGWTRLSRFGFRLAGPAGSYRTVSYIDVLLGSVPPATFAGKTLLVGAVADSRLNDQLAVMGAGARAGGLPGVEVHANAIDVLMQGRAIEFPSGTQRWLWLALPIWAALAAFMLSARYAAVSALALALLMAGLGAVALREARVALPIATPLAGIAAAYLLWSWRRLAALLHFFRQRVDALNAVPSGAFEPVVAPAPPAIDAIEQRTRALDRAIDRLVTLQSMLRQSVALMPAAVLICRDDGQIGQSNAAAQALLIQASPNGGRLRDQRVGDATDPLAGRGLFALLAALPRTDVGAAAGAAPSPLPGVWHDAMTGEYATPAGDVFRLHAVPLGTDGSRTAPHWIVVLHALTAERRAQREREELFAFFSHDLRAPQVSILSLLALHADGDPATDTPALRHGVAQAVQRTLAMADGFMTMMEAESNAYRLAAVPLGAVAMDAMDAVWADAQRRGVVLKPPLSDEAGCVMADGALLARALRNLLDNAIRHSASGSEIHVCLAALPDAAGRPGELLLSIRDEGEGMDAERLSRAREAGHRRTRSAKVPGWGIGLAVVNTVITRHGGWVEVSSRPGAGTTFLIGLPQCADESDAEEA